eukprot:gene11947-25033_t
MAMSLTSCGHSFCLNCAQKWIETQILERSESFIPCPCGPCSTEFKLNEIEALIDSNLYNIIQRRSLELLVIQDPSLHFCHTPNCTYIASWKSESEDGPSKMNCPQCKREHCILCAAEPFHHGMNCEEAFKYERRQVLLRRRSEELSTCAYLVNINVKYCKKCRTGVVKESGCDKMKCRCGYKFCYKCGSENSICKCTSAYHGYWDNVAGTADFS